MTEQYISDKYQESFQFLQERKRRQVKQLVLLNNLSRDDQSIASTLLLSLFNRVLSSVYDDKLQVKFLPSQGILQEQLNSYNKLAQSDYIEMKKAKLDYDWIWDTLFFGRGYMETLRFNKRRKIMEPHVINPLVFGYDPYFEDPQDWRYYWKWITKNKWQVEQLIASGKITGIKKTDDIPSGIDATLWDYKVQRDKAKKAIAPPQDTTTGDVFQILEFYTYNLKGRRSVYWLDKNISKILMEEELDLEDGEEVKDKKGKTLRVESKWPIVTKEAFREPHSSVIFSIADLLEDKHRAKSVLLNLAFIAAKDKANPIYGYNPDKVRDITQFFSRQINQHIPMDDESAAWPLNKEEPMSAGLLQFISMLTTEANEPIGTGMAQQPYPANKKNTATEAAITQQLDDMAHSLQSKVLQFGESEFWSHWFHRYAKNGKALGSKMANIVGVRGVDTEEIDLKDFQTDFPPGVFVYSAKEAEYKELVLRRDLMMLYPQLQATMDPEGMRSFNKHVFFPKFLDDPSLIEVMFPPTLDELKAEDENEQLKNDQLPQVAEEDEHQTHIYIHLQVQPKTWAVWFHIADHEQKLAIQKKYDIMLAQQSQMGESLPAGNQVGVPQAKTSLEKRNPIAAASPLKTEIAQTTKSDKNKI